MSFGALWCRRSAHMARFTRLLCRSFEIGQHCGNAVITTGPLMHRRSRRRRFGLRVNLNDLWTISATGVGRRQCR